MSNNCYRVEKSCESLLSTLVSTDVLQLGSFIINIQRTNIVFIIERLNTKRIQLNTNPM